jgi:hypothetical protein
MDDPILLNKIKEFLGEQDSSTPRTFLYRNGSVSDFNEETQELQPGDKVVSFYTSNASSYLSLLNSIPEAPKYTAEEWLNKMGYTSIRLITLLDLENKLRLENKESIKLMEVRAWIDSVLAIYIQDPTPDNDWTEPPHNFEETVQEAFTLLLQ